MRKIALILIGLALTFGLQAQDVMRVMSSGTVVYEKSVSQIDSIKFVTENANIFNIDGSVYEMLIRNIDSIVFVNGNVGDIVYIQYVNNAPTIINPFQNQGVSVTVDGNDVFVVANSGIEGITYHLSGTTTDSQVNISSEDDFNLILGGVDITNSNGAAIDITENGLASITIANGTTNTLTDGTLSVRKAALYTKGNMHIFGNGTLNINGLYKHGICADDGFRMYGGNINILSAVSDGIHAQDYLVIDGGTIDIVTDGDGIDGDADYIEINDGEITIQSTADDVKGISCDSLLTINGGTINMTVSGAQSKGFKTEQILTVNGGTIDVETSGDVVLEASGSGYDPSYCTAFKADGGIVINGGNITIESTSTCRGGKGLSSDNSIIINDGVVTITTAGNGATYTNSSNQTDSYTAACIKSDGDVSLLGGTITCSSSGTGGKGVSAEGTIVIGESGASNDLLILDVTTTGERFYVSGSGGGGWPPGGSSDYANPKAIKSEGNLTINSGTITVYCPQTQEGGEGIESKTTLIINGGDINVYSRTDDCINAASNITINGGTTFCKSDVNDGVDSNGTLTVSGGIVISCGGRVPEEGFDCDNHTFSITGGTLIGTGGATSNPTSNACTQYSVKYTTTAGTAICITNSSGEDVLMYQMPTFSSGGGGGGGWGNNMLMLHSSPSLMQGSYTLKRGGTISGGTEWNGYYTGATYTGGTTINFNINNKVTTINGK